MGGCGGGGVEVWGRVSCPLNLVFIVNFMGIVIFENSNMPECISKNGIPKSIKMSTRLKLIWVKKGLFLI